MKQVGQFIRIWILPDKSIVIFCVSLLLLVWGGTFWQIEQDRTLTTEMIRNDGDKFTRAFEEHTRRVLKTNEQYLIQIKGEYERTNTLTPSLERLFALLRQDPLVCQVGIFDASGKLVLGDLPAPGGANAVLIPNVAVHKAADTGSAYLGVTFTDPVSQQLVLPMTRRLNRPDGSFAGIAVIGINPYYFSKFYQDMELTEHYTVRLIGLDGVIRSSNSTNEIGSNFSRAKVFQELAQKSSGFYFAPGTLFGKVGYMSYRAMADYPLIVQVGLAERALQPLYQRRSLYLAGAGGASLFILLYTVGLMRRARSQRLTEQKLQASYQELTATHEELLAAHEELLATEEELRRLYSEVVATNEKLENSRRETEGIFHAAGDGLIVTDEETGKILAINRRMTEIFGYSEAEFKERGIALISLPEKREEALTIIQRTVAEGPQALYERETHDSQGQRLVLEISATPVMFDGKVRCLALVRDVTSRKLMEEGMEFLRVRDPVTGVYNRAHFETDLLKGPAGKTGVGMFVCDVDGLKLINDTLGHRQGDELLKRVASILDSGVEEPNYVSRIGGDEFAVVLFEPTRKRMEELEQAYRRKVERYNQANPHLPLSLSMGWSLDEETTDMEVVFKTADNNMYRQKLHQSQSVRSSIVHTMMKALEAKDHITEGHADRLGTLMEQMGQKLLLPPGDVADLWLLAKFHDIGKVGIPDSILKKPAKLTEEEMAIMRQHCEIGFRIAKASPDLAPIADWILKHQEHWDGGGYPLGIKGEQIPLQCRILGIIDAFDAMTSDRPYRKAMPVEAAIAELRRCAGRQFDPALTEEFIQMLDAADNLG